MAVLDVLDEVRAELEQARRTHPPMNGHHEGYAVILEELDELWDECKRNTHAFARLEGQPIAVDVEVMRRRKREAMRREALQVAAMAVRFIVDVCDVLPPHACTGWTCAVCDPASRKDATPPAEEDAELLRLAREAVPCGQTQVPAKAFCDDPGPEPCSLHRAVFAFGQRVVRATRAIITEGAMRLSREQGREAGHREALEKMLKFVQEGR